MTADRDLERLIDIVAAAVYVLNTRDGIAAVTRELAMERARNAVSAVIVTFELRALAPVPERIPTWDTPRHPLEFPKVAELRELYAQGKPEGHGRSRLPGLPNLQPRTEGAVTLLERFNRKIETPRDQGGCWEWTGAKGRCGYGHMNINGVTRVAHRIGYELLVGQIPGGMTLDHLCRNRACVRPDHLSPATHRDNTLRGDGPTAQNSRKTHCPRGHEYTSENT